MIIPVRCFTCNKVLANKWAYYKAKEEEAAAEAAKSGKAASDTCSLLLPGDTGKLLTEMGLTRLCCRRHMKAHIDLMSII